MMFIIANFLNAVAYVLEFALNIYMYVIIARAILSWVNPDPYNPIVNFLYRVTDPVLYRVRRMLPDMGGLDLSPIIVILAIFFMQKFLVSSIFELVNRLKFGSGVMP
jgi:YggT family protein